MLQIHHVNCEHACLKNKELEVQSFCYENVPKIDHAQVFHVMSRKCAELRKDYTQDLLSFLTNCDPLVRLQFCPKMRDQLVAKVVKIVCDQNEAAATFVL